MREDSAVPLCYTIRDEYPDPYLYLPMYIRTFEVSLCSFGPLAMLFGRGIVGATRA